MFSTLDVDVRPGSGIGRFEIGQSLWATLETLRALSSLFPQIDIKYDPSSSPSSPVALTPIILHIRPHLDLLFSGKHQRLHTICLRRLRDPNPPVTIRYKDIILSRPEEPLTRVAARRTFGPTYPGDDLRYPGLWFSFEEDGIGTTLSGREGIVTPKSGSSDDRMQEVKRVLVAQKHTDSKVQDALDEVAELPIMAGSICLAVVKVHHGVTLYPYPSKSKPIHIQLGVTTAQDLVLDLGTPLRVHQKEDERMQIHSIGHTPDEVNESGYFYNYFQHGMDFLLSGSTHVVTKIILHSNIPGTPLFQRYQRCNWEIEGKPEDDEDDTPPRKRFYDRFETISHFLGPHEPAPSMHLDRTDEDEDIILPNPASRLYGYDGIILEVTESSQVVCAMLF